jgi:hypothetical protein
MPAHGRAGWAAIAIAVLVAGAPPGLTAESAAKRKRCKASQVKQTVTYRKRGRKHRVKGCAPRMGKVPGSIQAALPEVLRKTRAVGTKLASRKAKRARRKRAVRRLLRLDKATDAALGRYAGPTAQASSVTTGTETRSIDSRSTLRGTSTDWSGSEPRPGREISAVIDTSGAARKRKSVHFKHLIDRCPDAGGIARGTIDYTQSDSWTAGGVSQRETGSFSGDITAHFNDDARITAVDIDGKWSWSTQSSGSNRRAVRGTAATRSFHQSTGGNSVDSHVDIATTVVQGTDDRIAISGHYLGGFVAVMPALLIKDALDPLQARALGGACVRVVPNEPTVHVSPASTVPVVAHLVDSTGATFAGAITTTSERVQPQRADGNPDAQFTYAAPANASGTDFVRLEHTSRRGKANPGIVNVVIDSFNYRVLAAKLDETVDGERPPDFAQCPASGHQTNTMSLGPQPYDPATSSDGHLFDVGPALSGQIRASGTVSMSSNVTGCDLGGSMPTPCSGTGSFQDERDVTVQVDLPKAGGPARVQWFFNQDPTAGIGNESHGSCITYFFHARTENQSLGVRSVPRSVFESSGPATLSIEVPLDLPGDTGATVRATERYSLTIQRVTG